MVIFIDIVIFYYVSEILSSLGAVEISVVLDVMPCIERLCAPHTY
jgi:hypothetical protein